MHWKKFLVFPVAALLAILLVSVPAAQNNQNLTVQERDAAKHQNLIALVEARNNYKAEVSRDYHRAGFEKRQVPAKISQTVPTKAVAKVKPKSRPVVKTSAWVERVRLCIMRYESHGNYRALNRSSGASGAYQFMDATWHAVTGLGGKAMNYSVATQDAAFYKLFNNGKGGHHWVTYRLCA